MLYPIATTPGAEWTAGRSVAAVAPACRVPARNTGGDARRRVQGWCSTCPPSCQGVDVSRRAPADRWRLAEPVDGRLMLCGEAVGTSPPAMTHGAFENGERAAHRCLSARSPGDTVVVIGAGLSGLAAARTLVDAGANCVVVEARGRLGGRGHTIELAGGDVADSRVEGSSEDARASRPVTADAGASWLQQFSRNLFARMAQSLGAHLFLTDFHAPRASARRRTSHWPMSSEHCRSMPPP